MIIEIRRIESDWCVETFDVTSPRQCRRWSTAATVTEAMRRARKNARLLAQYGATADERFDAGRALETINRIEFVAGPDPRD